METNQQRATDPRQTSNERIPAPQLSSWLLSQGKASATTEELAQLLQVPPDQVRQRLAPLRRRGEIVSPARGLWIPVSPEYRTWGAPPAFEFIDALMKYRGVSYYVGWLSAAALLGASHHSPQVFQVATLSLSDSIQAGRSAIQFYIRKNVDALPVVQVQAKSGAVPVSSGATTLLDIATDIKIAGGLDNVANVVIELACATDGLIPEIMEIAPLYSAAAVRRLGYLLDTYTETSGLDDLARLVATQPDDPSLLDYSKPRAGKIDSSWMLDINTEIEPDV